MTRLASAATSSFADEAAVTMRPIAAPIGGSPVFAMIEASNFFWRSSGEERDASLASAGVAAVDKGSWSIVWSISAYRTVIALLDQRCDYDFAYQCTPA